MTKNMHRITTISSLNLRTSRGKADRTIDEPIDFSCSFCRRSHAIGDSTFVLVKVEYCLNGSCKEVQMCEVCVDVFTDLIRSGPRVLSDAHTWKRVSRVVRMGSVHEDLFCFNCFSDGDSHVFVKFDDLTVPGPTPAYETKRVCAKCAICYFDQMERKEQFAECEFPQHEEVSAYV